MADKRLIEAVKNGELEDAKRIVTKDKSVVNTIVDGKTALHVACECQGEEFVQFLLQNGADIEAVSKPGSTPLHLACSRLREDPKLVQLLLKHKANINARAWHGRTPLYIACDGGNVQTCLVLLTHGADVHAKTDEGSTPLFPACKKGLVQVCEQLILKGSDVNVKDKRSSPLNSAVSSKNKDLCELLINKGADVNPNLTSPPIHTAAKNGLTDICKLLLNRGASLKTFDDNGLTALHSACKKGQLESCKLLLEAGADINARCRGKEDGLTPLHSALSHYTDDKHKSIVEFLLKNGADIHAVAKPYGSVLHMACGPVGNKDLVELLLKNGASVHAKDDRGCTPLHEASRSGHNDLVTLLLKRGADVNAADQLGGTPLMAAAKEGKTETVRLLINKGAKVNTVANRSMTEYTALHAAAENGHCDVVKCLLQHKADDTIKNDKGHTALDVAKKKELKDMVALLENPGSVPAPEPYKDTEPAGDAKNTSKSGTKSTSVAVSNATQPPKKKGARHAQAAANKNAKPAESAEKQPAVPKQSSVKKADAKQPQSKQTKNVQQVQQKLPAQGAKDDKAAKASTGATNGATASKGGHIMISYQWEYQETVKKIRDELKKRNFRVWLDIDHMSGNIMDAMSEAVEGATAVLMCVSSSYKDSKACKAEIEYADLQKKPIVPLMMERGYQPTGWLGMMLGKKLYFDFSGKYPFEAKIGELVRELEVRGLRT